MLFLGFTDDVLDWPWRYKLILPTIASLPLLCCYEGSTSIVIPIQMRSMLMQDGALTWFGKLLCYFIVVDEKADGAIVNLGLWYLVYMGMLAVFCTNAINIYAGINGIEVGQTLIIALGLLFFCSAKNAIISYIFVAVALLLHNKFPASVFVGDSWCYLSGMFFVAVARHETEQLAIIMFPQIINTILSLPELTGYKECPRHRMPKYDESTDKLYHSGYGTLMNIILWANGPMHESALFYILVNL